jgi:serine/threonine-protein kinase
LAGAAFVLLGATTVLTTLSYWRAEAARAEAEARFADARGAAGTMIRVLLPRLAGTPGTLQVRVDAAAAAQVYLDRLAASPQASDAVRIEAADGLLRLAIEQAGAGRANLDQPDRADANLRKAAALLAPLGQSEARRLRAEVLLEQVRLAVYKRGDAAGAAQLAAQADAALHLLPEPGPGAGARLTRMRAMVVADLAGWQGRFADEEKLAAAALAHVPASGGRQDQLDRFHLLTLRAEGLYYLERPAEALALYRDAQDTISALRRTAPGDPYLRGVYTVAAWAYGVTLSDLGRPREALAVLVPAEGEARAAAAFDPADREARRRLRIIRNARGQALGLAGQTDAALAQLEAVRRDDELALSADPSALHSRDAVFDHTLIGETLDAAGRKEAACSADRDTVRLYAQLAQRGLLTALDQANNIKLAKARIAKNCRG